MLSRTQGLRWSGKSISKARQRVPGDRQFSSNGFGGTRTALHHRPSRYTYHPPRIHQQYRALSLFGWGSSSKPSPPPPINTSSPSPDVSSPSSNLQISEPSPSIFGTARTVKATHGTSDVPDPSLLQGVPPGQHEPTLVKDLQDAIATPHGPNATSLPETDIASTPERVGYLKEVCGIDFGWGTTSIFQYVVESLHVYSGMTWGLSFITLTLVARALLLRVAYRGQEATAKMQEIQPILAPLREEYKEAAANGDKIKMQTIGSQIRSVSRESGVSMLAPFKPMLFQIPLSFAGYRLGYAMGNLPVPSLENETFLWMSNLALADPYAMPLFVASLTYLTLAKSMAIQKQSTGSSLEILKYILPVFSVFFISWQSGVAQLFFAIQALCSYGQIYLFMSGRSRAWLRLPPLRVKGPATMPTLSSLSSSSSSSSSSPQPPPQMTIAGMTFRSPQTPPGPPTIDATSRTVDSQTQPPSGSPSGTQQPSPSTIASENISMLDKFVDSAKARRDAFKGSYSKVTDTFQSNKAKQAKKNEEARRDQYEYKRRQDVEMERRFRNDQAQAQAQGKSGKQKEKGSR